jgi:hypothetical protein
MTFHGISISCLVASSFSIVGASNVARGKSISGVAANFASCFPNSRLMEKVTTRPCSFKRSGRQAIPFSLTPAFRGCLHSTIAKKAVSTAHFYQGMPAPKCTGIDGKPLKRLVSIFAVRQPPERRVLIRVR